MIFYNWPKIFVATEGNPLECVRILEMLTYDKLPQNRLDPIYKYSKLNFRGESFLLHPDVLLYNGYRYTNRDIAVYASIASMRPYALYQTEGIITLPAHTLPINPHEFMDHPELLPIVNDEVHFLFEVTPPKEEQH